MQPCRIACLSLLDTPGRVSGYIDQLDRPFSYDIFPISPDLGELRSQIERLLESYDAVALDGIASTFRIGPRTIRYEYLWRALDLERWGSRASDGSSLQSLLERHLVRQAAEQLKDELSRARVLIFSGLTRYGSADVLSGYTRRLMFGDLLYGFRLGLPIIGFRNFMRQAPQLARTVSNAPLHWFWPSAREHRPLMPRFGMFVRRANVIVGGISYFRRFAPKDLQGKIIFTNIYRDEDIELFANRGARYVISLTPILQGQYVPMPVLGAYLKHPRCAGRHR